MIECEDGALYTGISNHLIRRWRDHTSGRGAKFFRSRQAKQVIWFEYPHDHRSAARREYEIKQLSRSKKLALIHAAKILGKTRASRLLPLSYYLQTITPNYHFYAISP